MLSVLPLQDWWSGQRPRGKVALVMIVEIKVKGVWLSFSTDTTRQVCRGGGFHGQLFYQSAARAGINRALNTGSCGRSLLWRVTSGIAVVVLIWWNISPRRGCIVSSCRERGSMPENMRSQSNSQTFLFIICLLINVFDGCWWSHICLERLLKKTAVVWGHADMWLASIAAVLKKRD